MPSQGRKPIANPIIIQGNPNTKGCRSIPIGDNLFDVTNCILTWALLDPDGNPLSSVNGSYTINKTDPTNGGIQITVPREYTALDPGRYTDALQVVEGASKGIFWIGQIVVAASPFAIPR
jgi:hypothetical protein